MLLSGKGTQELQLWPKPAQEKRARSENLTGRFVWKWKDEVVINEDAHGVDVLHLSVSTLYP